MIQSFKDSRTKDVFERQAARWLPPDIVRRAERKLRMLDTAPQLEGLRIPPGNHLELLTGDRAGQYSIRINDQWRICFEWDDGNPHHVEIVDYHR